MKAISNFFTGSNAKHYRIEGKIKFHLEPTVVKGKLPFHTSSISLKAYKSSNHTVQLPVKIKWFRYIADRHYEIAELNNKDVFDFSAMDIGCEIKAYVKITENSEGVKGGTNITFGPIRFDPNIRPPLESVLLSGFSKFNVMADEEDEYSPDNAQPISVFVSPNQIKFFYYSGTEEDSFYLELNNDYPKLIVPPNEIEKLVLRFNEICFEDGKSLLLSDEKEKNKSHFNSTEKLNKVIFKETGDENEKYELRMRFFSRNSRDIFMVAARLFRIVPVVTLSNLFRQIDILLREDRLFEKSKNLSMNDLLVEHDLLRNQLLSTIEYVKDLDREKDDLQDCVLVLEKDLQNTIEEFKRLIVEANEHAVEQAKSHPQKNNLLKIEDAEKRLEKLNASLLSNRQDYKEKIEKNLDVSQSHIRRANSKGNNYSFISNASNAGGNGGGGVSKEEYERVLNELERMKKTKNILLKELTQIKNKKKKKKLMMKKAIKDMSMRMENVSKDLSAMKNQPGDHTIISNDSGIDSRIFSVHNGMKDISMIEKSEDILKFEDSLLSENSDLFQDPKSRAEMGKLRAENTELMKTIEILQTELRDATIKYQKDIRSAKKNTNEESDQILAKVVVLENENQKLNKKLVEIEGFLTDFRKGMKLIVDNASIEEVRNEVNTENLSYMESVFEMSNENKLKLLNLENQGLAKRSTSQRTELTMLRTEIKNLRLSKAETYGTKGVSDLTGITKSITEETHHLREENKNLKNENDNLKDLLEKMKQIDEVSNVNGMIENLKAELAEIKNINSQLIFQRDELVKRSEEFKKKAAGGEAESENNDAGSEQVRTANVIIEQLQSRNGRLAEEIMRLQEQMKAIEDARASFISDSMNDSYMQNSLAKNQSAGGKSFL